ncbi:putative tRNA sulfurtransferase [Diplonema papillatum]|nr:putative tRNA sulfurtransferase [Diplonema papillatum]
MERLKALFPGEDAMIEDVLRVVSEHHRRKAAVRPVSFDQAASSEMTPEAVTAQVVGNLLLTANSNSTHTSGQAAHALSTRLKQAVLSFANVPSPSEAGVHFTDGGADANEFVLKSMLPVLPRRLGGGVARDVLLVGSIEHASLLDRAAELKSRGYVTHPIPIDTATGVYSVQYVREKLAEFGERVALVSMHHANNEIGAIQPLAEVGAAVRELTPKALFHADCIQTLGKIPIDLPAWRADAVTLSFHKVGGPKRTGAVVAAKANSLPAAFKATQDVASQIASWVAAAEAVGKLGETASRLESIGSVLLEGIVSLCGELGVTYRVLSSKPPVGIPGIVNLLFPGMQGRHVVAMLSDKGVNVSSGAACSSQNDEPSKVISSLKVTGEDYHSAVRFSFGPSTTENDVERLLSALRDVLTRLSGSQTRELSKRKYNEEITHRSTGAAAPPGPAAADNPAAASASPAEHADPAGAAEPGAKKRKEAPTNEEPPAPGKAADAVNGAAASEQGNSKDKGNGKGNRSTEWRSKGQYTTRKEKRAAAQPAPVKHPETIDFGSPEDVAAAFKQAADAAAAGVGRCDAVMVTFGELVLKGANRKAFEKKQVYNLRRKLDSDPATQDLIMWTPQGYPQAGFLLLFFIRQEDVPKGGLDATSKVSRVPMPARRIRSDEYETVLKLLKEVSGLLTIVPVLMAPPKWDSLRQRVFESFSRHYRRAIAADPALAAVPFGVRARRGDKAFPIGAEEINRVLGSNLVRSTQLLEYKVPLVVNLKKPLVHIEVRVRQDVTLVFVSGDVERGEGGLPSAVDDNAKVLGLLSGGHDSPVACHKMMRRGCHVSFVHFDGYPYVGREVVLKIRKIQGVLNRYQEPAGRLFVVPFAKIQETIVDTAGVSPSYRTVLYRVYMFRLSQMVAAKHGFRALCTGDNLGQVASQTLSNMATLDGYSDLFTARPLVTSAKDAIIADCEKLGFYEYTKLYGTADCCTVFQPSNPVLHVQKEALARAVARLDEAGMQAVLQEAFAGRTIYDGSDDKDLILPAVPTPPQACPFVPKQSRQAAATAGNPNEALKPNQEQDAPMAAAAAEEVSKQNTKQDTPITATNNHEQDTPMATAEEASKQEADLKSKQDTPMAAVGDEDAR